jgi:hypothetical protein
VKQILPDDQGCSLYLPYAAPMLLEPTEDGDIDRLLNALIAAAKAVLAQREEQSLVVYSEDREQAA